MNTKSEDPGSHPLPVISLIGTLVAQTVGFGVSQLFTWEQLYLVAPVHALVAGLIAYHLTLPLVWRTLNVVLPVAAYILLQIEIPSWVFLAAAVFMTVIFVPTLWTRVPYYPSSKAMYEAVLAELPKDREIVFVDLGSGFGRMLRYLARKRPESKFIGFEISPAPWFFSKVASLRTPNVSNRFQDFWKVSLQPYDVVYTFLAPPPMEEIWRKVKTEMRPGSLYLNNSFGVPAKAEKAISVPGPRQRTLYRHEI